MGGWQAANLVDHHASKSSQLAIDRERQLRQRIGHSSTAVADAEYADEDEKRKRRRGADTREQQTRKEALELSEIHKRHTYRPDGRDLNSWISSDTAERTSADSRLSLTSLEDEIDGLMSSRWDEPSDHPEWDQSRSERGRRADRGVRNRRGPCAHPAKELGGARGIEAVHVVRLPQDYEHTRESKHAATDADYDAAPESKALLKSLSDRVIDDPPHPAALLHSAPLALLDPIQREYARQQKERQKEADMRDEEKWGSDREHERQMKHRTRELELEDRLLATLVETWTSATSVLPPDHDSSSAASTLSSSAHGLRKEVLSRTHAHARTRTHTHTHTQTLSLSLPLSLSLSLCVPGCMACSLDVAARGGTSLARASQGIGTTSKRVIVCGPRADTHVFPKSDF